MSDPNMEEGSNGMARDTKVGLLAGLAFIICFAIILSNRGAQPPQQVDQPYLVDRGVNTRHAAQPATSPATTSQTLSGRAREGSLAQPQPGAGNRPVSPVRPGNPAGDNSGGDMATTGASIVLPMQTAAAPYGQAPVATDVVRTEHLIPGSVEPTGHPQSASTAGQISGTSDHPLASRPQERDRVIGADGYMTTPGDQQHRQLQPVSGPAAERAIPPGAAPAATRPNRHTVLPGETLYKIAMQYYGNRSTSVVNSIYQANRSVLSSPNVLHVGVELMLPAIDGVAGVAAAGKPAEEKRTAAPPEKPASKPEAAQPLPRWYQVRKNDGYTSIAREQLGDAGRWREIHQLNKDKFPDPQRIREGVRIRLPGTAVASAGGGRS